MAKIGLTEGFTLIPEGTHVFQITAVKYDEDFGKMEISMQTASGQKHTERFALLNKDGEPNDGALNAFSYFAKTVMNDYTLPEIDHEDLVGHFIRCEVEHEEVPSNRNPQKMLKFVRLGEKVPCDGFEDAPEDTPPREQAAPRKAAAPAGGKPKFDLDSLLG